MKESLHCLLWLFNQDWFITFIVAPTVGFAVDWLLKHNRGLKLELTKTMLAVEKAYPDWSGEEKKEKAIEWIRAKSPLANKLPLSQLSTILEAVIEEIKKQDDA